MIVGIDPGKTGAIAAINELGQLSGVCSVPLDGKHVNHTRWAAQWKLYMSPATHIYIEQVGARPGQGVTSMFNFGSTYGFALGLVNFLQIPYTMVTPQKWRGVLGIPNGADKGASRVRACSLFPDHAKEFARVKDDGRAEAALIAYAGYLIQKGKVV